MKNKKTLTAVMACVLVMGAAGCAGGGEQAPDSRQNIESLPHGSETEERTDNGAIIQDGSKAPEEAQVQTPSAEEDGAAGEEKTDAVLEEELRKYRQEREDTIQESNGLVEGGTPDESNYSFDTSGTFYAGRFDTRELTQAYETARIYVTDTLGISPETKMATYMCIDPRILEIYEDEEKGVAAGYDNDNIFVCEYCNGDGVWQYLVLVRDGKGDAWSVIHNGSSYKE